MFADEAKFGRISEPRRCWAPAPLRPEAPCQVVREYIHAFVAVAPHKGILDSLILPRADAGMMSLFLAEVRRQHPRHFIIMVLDGAGMNSSAHLRVPKNMRIVLQPPYSPRLNPVEPIWGEVHEKAFPNIDAKDLNEIEDRLAEELRNLGKDRARVRSITGFDWILDIRIQ